MVPVDSDEFPQAPGPGQFGSPSNKTTAEPARSPETQKFHIIQPVVLNQKNRSPGQVEMEPEHLGVLDEDAAVAMDNWLGFPRGPGRKEDIERVVEIEGRELERVGGRRQNRPIIPTRRRPSVGVEVR